MTEQNALLGAALWYASKLGWPVFPLAPRSKVPKAGSHGLKEATTDPAAIGRWWREDPAANIGSACGRDRVVVDLDGQDGIASWRELVARHANGRDVATVTVLTGGGGEQLVFAVPAGVEIRNSAGKLGPAIDVRANGGYHALPPSIHPSGRPYRWETGHGPQERPVAPLPGWLVRLLTATSTPRHQAQTATPELIPKGRRNHDLTSFAGRLRRVGATPKEILAALKVRNADCCQPPLPASEVAKIAESVGRYSPCVR
jgi:hypothetical protein